MKWISLILAAFVAAVTADTALEEFAAGNRLFTARLYNEVLKNNHDANFVFSPLSIEIILALTQAGAKGKTAEEFTTALNLPSTQQKTQEALKQFLPTLKSNTNDLKLSSANKLFLGEAFEILESFKQLATSVFEAGAENIDFSKNQAAAESINKWVESQTNNKIQNLINPDSLSAATRLVLVNALYFKGKWSTPFEDYLTRKEKFFVTKTNSKEVDMMHVEDTFRYYECTKRNAKFLELPYAGENVTMTIVLPNEVEGLTALESNVESLLTPPPYNYERVAVSLPKWLVETKLELNQILENLGLKTAFTGDADFSNLSKEALQISQVVQKAFINVTESGTEAAAATAVTIQLTSAIQKPIPKPFRADHPYLYFIKYDDIVLFIGKNYNI
ncbi:antichymotrypsin-2-like isoform X4 [Sitophilus oryzae]|uniref:Antichymotrypsin-2-like isoform X4 n=1 Tax=Sitophilus oryzae TaxID=7048 RepID=A0A6J2YMI7_SITOR|nr:antichymotrypsin-2-like isoform X4 [Sitophilus oryzae]